MTKKQTILITGCSADGIGAVLALTLAKQGHHIFATARNTSKIPPELSNLSNVFVIALDVSSQETVTKAAKAIPASGNLSGPELRIIAIDHLPAMVARESSDEYSSLLLPSLLTLNRWSAEGVWKRAEQVYRDSVAELP